MSLGAVLVGGAPSVSYGRLAELAKTHATPVLVPRSEAKAGEILELLSHFELECHPIGDDFVEAAFRVGVHSILTFDEAYAFKVLEANVRLAGSTCAVPKDKLEMRELLNSCSLSSTRTWPVTDHEQVAELLREGPVILKPRAGVSSIGILKLQTLHDALALDARALSEQLASDEYFAELFHPHAHEEELDGDRYGSCFSVDVFSDGERFVTLVADRGLPTRDYAESVLIIPSRLGGDDINLLSERAIAIVKLWEGILTSAHIEFVRTSDGFEVIEVNLRPGGYLDALCKAAGANESTGELAFAALTGRSLPAIELSAHAAHVLIYPPRDGTPVSGRPDARTLRAELPDVHLIRIDRPGPTASRRQGSLAAVCEIEAIAEDRDSLWQLIDTSRSRLVTELFGE